MKGGIAVDAEKWKWITYAEEQIMLEHNSNRRDEMMKGGIAKDQ